MPSSSEHSTLFDTESSPHRDGLVPRPELGPGAPFGLLGSAFRPSDARQLPGLWSLVVVGEAGLVPGVPTVC